MKYRTYVYSIVGLMIILIVLLSVTSQKTLTYRSKASERPLQSISSLSHGVMSLSDTERGTCIRQLTYLPSVQDSQISCYIQFTCSDGVTLGELPQVCVKDETRITCDAQSACQSIQAWTQQAQKYCGCS